MQIRKRSGILEDYTPQKITEAMKKAFASVEEAVDASTLAGLLKAVEDSFDGPEAAVEEIQDQVERVLMASGHYEAAKSYILYRQKRTELRSAREEISCQFEDSGMEACLTGIQKDFDPALYSISTLSSQFSGFVKPGMELEERIAVLTKAAIELTSPETPDWEKIAARFLNYGFRRRLSAELDRLGIHSFYEKLSYLTEEGLYGDYILNSYSKEELELAASFLDDSRDQKFKMCIRDSPRPGNRNYHSGLESVGRRFA